MTARPATPKPRLTPDDWVTEALTALAEGGIAAVAVEPLAARLGATKGSFYWHFASRDALLEAVLARWEQQTTTEIATRVHAAGKEPADRLRMLITDAARLAETDRAGLALLASAAHPVVAPVLSRVTEQRLAITTTMLGELGFDPATTRRRALLAYSAYLGHAQLTHTTPELLSRDSHAYLDEVIHVLTSAADQQAVYRAACPPAGAEHTADVAS